MVSRWGVVRLKEHENRQGRVKLRLSCDASNFSTLCHSKSGKVVPGTTYFKNSISSNFPLFYFEKRGKLELILFLFGDAGAQASIWI